MAFLVLLFPTFSTADDFHVCHQSVEYILDAGAMPAEWEAGHPVASSPDETLCIACLWSTFDTTMALRPISLNASLTSFESYVPPEPSLPDFQAIAPKAGRAPPLA